MKTRIWYLLPLAIGAFALSCGQENTQAGSAQIAPQAVGSPIAVAAELAVTSTPNENGWFTSWDDALAAAKTMNRPVIIDFYTDWCHWCTEMDEKTFSHPSIRQKFADNWVMLKVNAENAETKGTYKGITLSYRELAQKFGVTGYPSYGFLDKAGEPVNIISGYREVPQFSMILDYFQQEIYKLDEAGQKKFMETHQTGT